MVAIWARISREYSTVSPPPAPPPAQIFTLRYTSHNPNLSASAAAARQVDAGAAGADADTHAAVAAHAAPAPLAAMLAALLLAFRTGTAAAVVRHPQQLFADQVDDDLALAFTQSIIDSQPPF